MAHERNVSTSLAEEIQVHGKYGELMPALSCPVFVDRLPVLNARILLGLYEYRFPIAPLERNPKSSRDGHTVQFLWYQVRRPTGYVDPDFHWPGNPYESALFDREKGYFHDKLFQSLIDHYGKIGIYYPLGREMDLDSIFNHLQKNNYEIHDAGIHEQWKLRIVTRR
jgi:hypothetical protein